RFAVDYAELDFLVAGHVGRARIALAVGEAPDAAHVRRYRAGQHDADRVVARDQIVLAHAVAVAGVDQLAGAVEAQALDRVASPPGTGAAEGEPALGPEHAVAADGGDLTLEVGLAAEQAEPVLDLPLDAQPAVRLRLCTRPKPGREQQCRQSDDAKVTHDGPALGRALG